MTKGEARYVLGWSALIMALTCAPYVLVWSLAPADGRFPGILFNSDDHAVYFAWMRQAADGHLLFRNLFTTDPQRGAYLHVYFLGLGWLSRLPWLDLPLTYHLGRVLFGIVTLALVYRLSAFFAPDVFRRRCVFWTTALSGGLGWLFWTQNITQREPVDVWQPEALTFPSLYTNGLFAVSLALMLGVVVCLLLAETRNWRWALGAGACGLLLGNIHSYDVIHLAAAWGLYLAARGVAERKVPWLPLRRAMVAAAVAAPSVLYMAWLYVSEPVFQARADTATLSPPLHQYALGYGLLVPLGVWGALLLRRASRSAGPADRTGFDRSGWLLPVAWVVAGLAAAYLPFAFQRKMIMGVHLPLALLAGLAVAEAALWLAPRARLRPAVVALLLVLLLSISSLRYLERDVRLALGEGRTSTGLHPVHWPRDLLAAYAQFGRETPSDAALLTWPTTGVLAPAYSGRRVYAGHWGETPRFGDRFAEVRAFYRGGESRERFLREREITHILLGPVERAAVEQRLAGTPRLEQEPFLRPAFQVGGVVIFEVLPPRLDDRNQHPPPG
jgi:hypothetical protein